MGPTSCARKNMQKRTFLSSPQLVFDKVRLLKAEVIEALLYGCATWTLRSEDFDSLRIAHHKLLLRVVGFRRKDCTGYKPLSLRAVLKMTECERVETTIRKRQLWFAGALVRQEETRLPRRLMNGRLTARGHKEVGRPPQAMGRQSPGEPTCTRGCTTERSSVNGSSTM